MLFLSTSDEFLFGGGVTAIEWGQSLGDASARYLFGEILKEKNSLCFLNKGVACRKTLRRLQHGVWCSLGSHLDAAEQWLF